jgi:multiple sugar transport system permease protein
VSGAPRGGRRRHCGRVFPWLLLSPALALVVLVTFLPVVQAARLSLHETRYLEQGPFIGLAHYTAFLRDPLSRRNLLNTLTLTFASLAVTLPMALGLALLLNQPLPGRAVFRTILILPWVVSQVLAGLLWRWVDSPLIGPVAYVAGQLTNSRVDVLGNPNTAMLGVVAANVWRTFPFPMVLALAALQTVPDQLYEAARIDGAGRWASFRYVTFPMIQNTLLIATIILSVHCVNLIELPLVLTGGGPVNATEVLGLRVYREAFVLQNFGFGSAIAMVMFAINVVLSLGYIRVLRAEPR